MQNIKKPRNFVQHRIHTRHKKKDKLDDNFSDCRTCRTWKIMQSCSTQNHTRGSWHQTELVRADLGSLMRWARTQREDWVGPCEGLAALSSPGVKQINDCCTEAKQKQASKHQYVSNCTLHRHTWVVLLLLLLLLLPSFLPSFLPHHLHFFVRHCKKTKKNTFNHNNFKQALPELLMY